jgi:hypothetical protein
VSSVEASSTTSGSKSPQVCAGTLAIVRNSIAARLRVGMTMLRAGTGPGTESEEHAGGHGPH